MDVPHSGNMDASSSLKPVVGVCGGGPPNKPCQKRVKGGGRCKYHPQGDSVTTPRRLKFSSEADRCRAWNNKNMTCGNKVYLHYGFCKVHIDWKAPSFENVPGHLSQTAQQQIAGLLAKPMSTAEESGYIYVFQIAAADGTVLDPTLYKVGRTKEIHTRLVTWSGRCGNHLRLVEEFPEVGRLSNTHLLERLIQLELSDAFPAGKNELCKCGSVHREMFRLPEGKKWEDLRAVITRWIDVVSSLPPPLPPLSATFKNYKSDTGDERAEMQIAALMSLLEVDTEGKNKEDDEEFVSAPGSPL